MRVEKWKKVQRIAEKKLLLKIVTKQKLSPEIQKLDCMQKNAQRDTQKKWN